jgi:hypothetical protein
MAGTDWERAKAKERGNEVTTNDIHREIVWRLRPPFLFCGEKKQISRVLIERALGGTEVEGPRSGGDGSYRVALHTKRG